MIEANNIYLGDCLELMKQMPDKSVDAVITDPPYPNNAGHFNNGIERAIEFCKSFQCKKWLVFWNEMEAPPVPMPCVAKHIWHRSNANGRPYEMIYEYNIDGIKRRSQVKAHCHIHSGVGAGSFEYAGHPTQKPVAVMEWLLCLTQEWKNCKTILDPFLGSGTTAVACIKTGRRFLGFEIDPGYYEIARKRIEAEQAQYKLAI